MSGFRTVLFDFFGTLTTAIHRGDAHITIARQLGCAPGAFMAALDRSFLIRARGGYGPPVEALRRVARDAGGTPGDDALVAAAAARVDAVRADIRLRADAVPVLAELRRRELHTGVVSDCCHELPLLLPGLVLAPLLSTCVYSIEQAACKPDPRMYLAACERLGVRPQECLYVGDGGSRELSGAEAVGMTAVRLAAPDLAGHLRFDADDTWTGPQISALSDSVALLDGVPDAPARPRPNRVTTSRWTDAGRRSDRAAEETARHRRTASPLRAGQWTAR
jgi:putative hydrolase of the HAD superfamily